MPICPKTLSDFPKPRSKHGVREKVRTKQETCLRLNSPPTQGNESTDSMLGINEYIQNWGFLIHLCLGIEIGAQCLKFTPKSLLMTPENLPPSPLLQE